MNSRHGDPSARRVKRPLCQRISDYQRPTEIGDLTLFDCPMNAPLRTRITERGCAANRKRARAADLEGDLAAKIHMATCLRCPGCVKLAAGAPLRDAKTSRRAKPATTATGSELAWETGRSLTTVLAWLAVARSRGVLTAERRGKGRGLRYPRQAAVEFLEAQPGRFVRPA